MRIEPIAYKQGELCTVELTFAPSKEYNKCSVREVIESKNNSIVKDSETQDFVISLMQESKSININNIIEKKLSEIVWKLSRIIMLKLILEDGSGKVPVLL